MKFIDKTRVTWKILRNVLVWICVLIALVGVLILQVNTEELPERLKGTLNFNKMTAEDMERGRFIKGTVYELPFGFAYEEVTVSRMTSRSTYVGDRYYALPMTAADGSTRFAALCVYDSSPVGGRAYDMAAEYLRFFETGNAPEDPLQMDITGRIDSMGGDIIEYLSECLDEAGYPPDSICPYVIVYEEEDLHIGWIIIGILVLAAGIAGCIWLVRWHIDYEKELLAEKAAAVSKSESEADD